MARITLNFTASVYIAIFETVKADVPKNLQTFVRAKATNRRRRY